MVFCGSLFPLDRNGWFGLIGIFLLLAFSVSWVQANGQSRFLSLPDKRPLDAGAIEALQGAPLGLFDAEKPLDLCLEADFDELLDVGAETDYRPAMMYLDFGDSLRLEFAMKIRPRGNTRLASCYFPPLTLNFPAGDIRLSSLHGLDKIKKVTPCLEGEHYQNLVLREYLVYRLYRVLTDWSFRVRLLRMEWQDKGSRDRVLRAWGFLIEEEERFALRSGLAEVKSDTLDFADLQSRQLALLAVFQYLIGNGDWSVPGRHNVKIFRQLAGEPGIAVPYDFDFSNMVNAHYPEEAVTVLDIPAPPPQYKGPCIPPEILDEVISTFQEHREGLIREIAAFPYLPVDEKGKMLDQLSAFLRQLESPSRLRQVVHAGCL